MHLIEISTSRHCVGISLTTQKPIQIALISAKMVRSAKRIPIRRFLVGLFSYTVVINHVRFGSALMIYSLRTRPLSSRIAIAVFVVIGIAALLGLVWYALEGFSSCSNVVLSSTRSPDGTKAVFVFRQECNATVTDSTYASIVPTDRPFSPDRNNAFLGFAGAAEVLSSWRENDAVEIALIPGRERGFIKHEERVGNIKVDYK